MRKHPYQHHIDAVLEEVKYGEITTETVKDRLNKYQTKTEVYRVALTTLQEQQQEWRRHPVKTRVLLAISLTFTFFVLDCFVREPFPFVVFEAIMIGFYTWHPEFIMCLLPRESSDSGN